MKKYKNQIVESAFVLLFSFFILKGSASFAQTDSIQTWIGYSQKAIQADNLAESLVYAQKAFNYARNNGSPSLIGATARQLGEVYRLQSDFEKADETLTLAVNTFEKQGNNLLHARSLADLARVKQRQRQYHLAIQLYTNALSIYSQKLDFTEAQKNLDLKGFIIERMAVVLSSLKQYDKAETYALEAVEIFESIGDHERVAVASTSLGNIYYWKKNYEKAREYYKKSYEISNSLGQNTGRNLNNLGIIAQESGDFDKAVEYYNQAIEQYKKIGSKEMIAQTQINLGDMYKRKGDFLKSIEWSKQGTDGLMALKRVTGLVEGYETLVSAYTQMRNFEKVVEYQNLMYKLRDSLFYRTQNVELMALQTKFETEKKDNDIQLLNKENTLRDLQIKQQQLDLTNQKLLTEKNEKAIVLLQQKKRLQESELALIQADLDKEKQFNENKNIQLALFQQNIKSKEQEALVQSKSNDLLRGAILAILLFGFLGWRFYLYRLKIMKERDYMAKIRLEEAAQKLWQETELRALRSQMNPHFIFNCLNSIKSLTLKNETDKASLYITKFSRLMRQVLENSRSEWISLYQELDTLKLYMDLEKLRFQNKFNYQLIVSPELSVHSIQVPPMFIQPYVENAIWHGLMHKEGSGEVQVLLTEKEGKQLIIRIIDDGIGRKSSANFNSKSANEKKSFGMQITAERMNILNQYYHINATTTILDLTDHLGNAIGTEVCMTIPI